MSKIRRIKYVSIAVIALSVSLLFSGVAPVQAVGTRDILLKAHLTTSTQILTGASDTAVVKLSAVPPGTSYDSFDVIVKSDNTVLTPTRIVLGPALPGAGASIYCINGQGLGCTLNDGLGIAHIAAHSIVNGVNGTLFKVVFKALNGIGVFGTVGTTVTIPCFKFAENGIAIAPSRFTVLTSTYGTVPAAAIPTATLASNQTAITITHGHSHNVTITTTGINGESSAITLTAITPIPAGQINAKFVVAVSPTIVSCNCGSRPALQLTLTPILTGTFTVVVTATIHGSSLTTVTPVSITVTSN